MEASRFGGSKPVMPDPSRNRLEIERPAPMEALGMVKR
jgi:hypothetical protein